RAWPDWYSAAVSPASGHSFARRPLALGAPAGDWSPTRRDGIPDEASRPAWPLLGPTPGRRRASLSVVRRVGRDRLGAFPSDRRPAGDWSPPRRDGIPDEASRPAWPLLGLTPGRRRASLSVVRRIGRDRLGDFPFDRRPAGDCRSGRPAC